MPTPVGPTPPDPNDPWSEWEQELEDYDWDQRPRRWPSWIRVAALILLVGFVLAFAVRFIP